MDDGSGIAPPHIEGYEILEELGQGGMAEVYLAEQKGFGRTVALKVVRLSKYTQVDQKELCLRFEREAKIVGKFHHPNIVTVYDVGTMGNFLYMSMELLKGGELTTKIKSGRVSALEACNIVRSMCEALSAVHAKKLIHRDIKPHNILFRDDATPVLTDFGIARSVMNSGDATGLEDIPDLTEVSMIIGSKRYMSPEQSIAAPLDYRSDIFSLGVVFQEMLTGERPVNFHDPASVSNPSNNTVAWPQEALIFKPLVTKMVEMNKENRYQSIDDVIEAMDTLDNKFVNESAPLRISRIYLFIPLLFLISVAIWILSPFTTNYELTALDPNNRLIDKSSLSIYLVEGLEKIRSFKSLPVGEHKIALKVSGYRTKVIAIDFPLERNTTINLTPVSSPSVEEFYTFQDLLEKGPANSASAKEFTERYGGSVLSDLVDIWSGENAVLLNELSVAAKLNDPSAQLALSELYDRGWYVPKNSDLAQNLSKAAAEQGYAFAQFQYALILMSQMKYTKDEEEFIRLLEQAAEQDFFLAELLLGMIYANREYRSYDPEQAHRYLRRAANKGDRVALYELAQMIEEENPEEAKIYRERAIRLGFKVNQDF
ncbi:serine/threonine-protein kinase [Ketobacter sp.]|uniref:serine/threonine-protein kinase n=1 Tax=Ketobacter sp. TaxID=2083498 RepID=UPI000F1F06EA|nr:serine/threonine-protein kinase [Ketobacter sp.]RLU01759.1 MAG: hypothetical protein D9N14_01075 [Ketobacter sp.]